MKLFKRMFSMAGLTSLGLVILALKFLIEGFGGSYSMWLTTIGGALVIFGSLMYLLGKR